MGGPCDNTLLGLLEISLEYSTNWNVNSDQSITLTCLGQQVRVHAMYIYNSIGYIIPSLLNNFEVIRKI